MFSASSVLSSFGSAGASMRVWLSMSIRLKLRMPQEPPQRAAALAPPPEAGGGGQNQPQPQPPSEQLSSGQTPSDQVRSLLLPGDSWSSEAVVPRSLMALREGLPEQLQTAHSSSSPLSLSRSGSLQNTSAYSDTRDSDSEADSSSATGASWGGTSAYTDDQAEEALPFAAPRRMLRSRNRNGHVGCLRRKMIEMEEGWGGLVQWPAMIPRAKVAKAAAKTRSAAPVSACTGCATGPDLPRALISL